MDPFASITGAVLDLLTRDGDLFLRLGTNLYRGIATIRSCGLACVPR